MKVILTEKPSVARDIAHSLAIRNRQNGYFEGNGYQITWAFGHLVGLQEPEDYDKSWKRWSLQTLPIIPRQFALKSRGDESAIKQLAVIKRLFQSSDEIICATDAGREGELIFRYILSWSECGHKPVKRLWISSLTDEAIRKGFDQLQDCHVYEGLYRAAKCRSEADWIVGMNATRLYTLKFGQGGALWTLGRVQTPVLAIVVQRDLDIAHFIPKDFWELNTFYREVRFQYTGGRFERQTEAETMLKRVKEHDFQITDVKGKQERILPPLLYDLTDLQKDMSLRYGFTAEKTLNSAQSLYEKKLITYPRTDSRCLSTDMKPLMKPLLERLNKRFPQAVSGLDLDRLPMTDRLFNDGKVSDHHAVIPTMTLPGVLTDDEAKVYEAVAQRLIASFYPPCLKEITTVHGKAGDTEFKTTGTVVTDPGWQALYKIPEAAQDDRDQKNLPRFEPGESGPHQPSVTQGKTTPPKHFTEAALLSMMELAGKTCDDEELREALKEKGLGTPATRASIIETLIKRNYLQRQKKTLLSTEAGRHLISLIADERLKSAAMTGEWESKLKKIERNDYDPDQFMSEIVAFTRRMTEVGIQPEVDETRLGDCPLCGHAVIEGRQGYGCSQWKNGCRFVLWKQVLGVAITPVMARQLLQTFQTHSTYPVHIDNEVLIAQLTLNQQGQIGYIQHRSNGPALTAALADCPLCNGKIVETSKGYSCSEWRSGCKTVIWKTIAHKKITPAMAKKLLTQGETGVLTGFKSSKGKEFRVNLKLIDGKVQMDFADKSHFMDEQ
ncbi:MAG: DNA topoisomerase 3 [Methylosarcina sp.]